MTCIKIPDYAPRCGPLGNIPVRPTWETTYGKSFRKPVTTSTTQYFTKTVRWQNCTCTFL